MESQPKIPITHYHIQHKYINKYIIKTEEMAFRWKKTKTSNKYLKNRNGQGFTADGTIKNFWV
jgi:hypothetical protein